MVREYQPTLNALSCGDVYQPAPAVQAGDGIAVEQLPAAFWNSFAQRMARRARQRQLKGQTSPRKSRD